MLRILTRKCIAASESSYHCCCYLLGDLWVHDGLPLEDGAGASVQGPDHDVLGLAGAEEAVAVVVSVHHHVGRSAQDIWRGREEEKLEL